MDKKYEGTAFYKWTVGRHSATTIEEVIAIYDSFADKYDDFYVGDGGTDYSAPQNSSCLLHSNLVKYGFGTDVNILDFGAGTGLVGLLLSKYGYNKLDALDVCQTMLEEARKKNVYKDFFCVDAMKDDMSGVSTNYDAIISVGCFTAGQIRPQGLEKLVRLTKPGGIICFTVRDITYEEESLGFKSKMEEMEKMKKWSLLQREKMDYHGNLNEECYISVYLNTTE